MRAENYLNSPMNENEAQSLNGRKLCENILEIKEISDKVKTENILKLQEKLFLCFPEQQKKFLS